jgi:hypothetical protein
MNEDSGYDDEESTYDEDSTFKAQAHLLIDSLPDDANWKMLANEIAVLQDIEEGLADSDEGNLLENDEVRLRYGGGE